MKPILLNLDTNIDTREYIEMMQGYDYTLECNIFSEGDSLDLSDYAVSVEMVQGNKKAFIVQTENITVEGNKATIVLDKDFTNSFGDGGLQIVLTQNGRVNGSWLIKCRIKISALAMVTDTQSKVDIDASLRDATTEAIEIDASLRDATTEAIEIDASLRDATTEAIEIDASLRDATTEAIEVKNQTETLIATGGAATKGDIAEVNAQLEHKANLEDLQNHINNHPSGGGGGSSTVVIDNLTSTSTTSALSANQGKVLDNKITVLSDEIANKASTEYVNNEIAKIELIPGRDGVDGNDGYTPVKGVDYFDGEKGEPGTPGINGQDGINGITPNISIGTVTTLEPGQNATVTKKGTTESPIFDFGIPKGKDGVGGSGGSSSSDVLAHYVHNGNKEINLTNFDISSGVYTCTEPHGMTKSMIVVPRVKNGGGFENIPKELFGVRSYSAVSVDENSFVIKRDNVEFTYSATDNSKVDANKFYFECIVEPELIIKLSSPRKSIEVHIHGITCAGDMYIGAYYDGCNDFFKTSKSVGSNYQGSTPLSSNAFHGHPRFFNSQISIISTGSSLITDGRNSQFGFEGRNGTDKSIAQVGSAVDFNKEYIEAIRIGSPVHRWVLTNGLSVVVKSLGGE